jgi:hypothetical protein
MAPLLLAPLRLLSAAISDPPVRLACLESLSLASRVVPGIQLKGRALDSANLVAAERLGGRRIPSSRANSQGSSTTFQAPHINPGD